MVQVERSDIVEGDHIYSPRTHLHLYAHHGIYIGNGLVIHFTKFTAPPGIASASSPPSVASSGPAPGRGQQRTCPKHPHCVGPKPGSGVAIICLDCFLEEGYLCRYEYGVSWFQQAVPLRGGTCTAEQSDPASTVLQRAKYLLENGFGNYNLVRNNCEDFALYCKTGILVIADDLVAVGNSGQIASVLTILFPFSAPYFLLGRNFLVYSIKVPVEDMDKYHRGSF